jgi:AraC family transcriptional regulator
MLQRLSEEAFAPGFASDILTEALGVAVLVDLSRYFDSISQTTKCENTGLENWQLRRIIEFINELSGRQPTLLDLAELCGIGKRTFMRRFKKSTGLTVSDYVQQQQLIKAEHYLQETDLPIKEISYRVGFASPSNFTLAFRRAVGQTPGQFRRHIK